MKDVLIPKNYHGAGERVALETFAAGKFSETVRSVDFYLHGEMLCCSPPKTLYFPASSPFQHSNSRKFMRTNLLTHKWLGGGGERGIISKEFANHDEASKRTHTYMHTTSTPNSFTFFAFITSDTHPKFIIMPYFFEQQKMRCQDDLIRNFRPKLMPLVTLKFCWKKRGYYRGH